MITTPTSIASKRLGPLKPSSSNRPSLPDPFYPTNTDSSPLPNRYVVNVMSYDDIGRVHV
ncbi:hypothetical protein D9758_004360 [Tetrapyrgos nigripes]|uniref:Uncharacterized protein n=1 Tax=Tetrapyrgos nigripes TaxID=182062 RepID=A0A8H5GNE3_9AGAR|nr:hypothetical protein D9758_004360 [Tetrapyrgos nigripes]